jgi:hypothetical protein
LDWKRGGEVGEVVQEAGGGKGGEEDAVMSSMCDGRYMYS